MMRRSVELTLRRVGSDAVPSLMAPLRAMYADAYAEPPYNYDDQDANEFVERLSSQAEREGFVLVLGEVGGELAGFSYGFQFPRDLWWRGAREQPPAEVASGSKFAVIELVVHRPFRGNGFSRQLLDAVLGGREKDWGILLAKPGAQAHAMYQRWGWVNVGVVQSYPHWPVDDAFVLPPSPVSPTT